MANAQDNSKSPESLDSPQGGDGDLFAGRYKILEVLGEGGVGKVLKCYDNGLGKFVAVKVLHHLIDNRDVVRFQNEAKAFGRLKHANITEVLDFNRAEDGRLYLVMEYCNGENLAEKISRDGALSLDLCKSVFDQLCSALQYAHENGIIHRDVKPSNVILCADAEKNVQVKLCDFGLAKFQEDDQHLTPTGDVLGTPAYTSPESARGQPSDARSDVYSTGCLIFECLSGRRPFDGDNPVETLMTRIERPEVPSTNAFLQQRELSEKLDRVISTCLKVDPAERFATIEQLKQQIDDAFESRSATDASALPESHVQPPILKRTNIRMIVTTLGAIFACILVLTMVLAGQQKFRQEERAQPEIDQKGQTLQPEWKDLKAMTLTETDNEKNNTVAFADSGLVALNSGRNEEAIKLLSKAIAKDSSYAVAYVNRGQAYFNLQRYREAIADANIAIKIVPERFEPFQLRAHSYAALGQQREAIDDFTKAISIQPRNPEPILYRGISKARSGDLQNAVTDYNRALELKPRNVKALYVRSIALYNLHKRKEAMDDITAAIHLEESIRRTKGPDYSESLLADLQKTRDLFLSNDRKKQ